MRNMKMKKISKVIVYYEDGTYEEVANKIFNGEGDKDKKTFETSPVNPIPYYSPSTSPTVKNPWDPPFTVTCNATEVPAFKFSDMDFTIDKYSINFSSNGICGYTKTGNLKIVK